MTSGRALGGVSWHPESLWSQRPPEGAAEVGGPRARPSAFPPQARATPERRTPVERLAQPDAEVEATLDVEAFTTEASRYLSCGSCFGWQQCWMVCNDGAFTRLAEPAPGAWLALGLGRCAGCGKCVELCPCGTLGLA
jgi:Pyruvate/2-oxoacid:ferredoxin oxidoreductase delta subunit